MLLVEAFQDFCFAFQCSACQGLLQITEVESTFEGTLNRLGFLATDEEARSGYDNIRVNLTVKGDVSAETLKELVRAT